MGQIKYLLDSNILSEPARLRPDDAVLQRFFLHEGEHATLLSSGMNYCMAVNYWQRR